MTQATPETKRRGFEATGLALIADLVLLGTTPAQAEHDHARSAFAHGFEDPMGRLLANEAFHIGRFAIAAGLQAHVAPVAVSVYSERAYRHDTYHANHRPRAPRRHEWRQRGYLARHDHHTDGRCGDDFDRYERRQCWATSGAHSRDAGRVRIRHGAIKLS